jgi:hypothetical protein
VLKRELTFTADPKGLAWRAGNLRRPRSRAISKERNAATGHRFAVTRWRSGMDSNRRSRLFDRKRPVLASFSFSVTIDGAPEAERRRTGF